MAVGDAQRIEDLVPALEDRSRHLGLYLTQASVVMTGTTQAEQAVLVVQLRLGDVAFSKRVQDPVGDDLERQVEALGVTLADEEYRETRERMARNLAAGRDPLDDGEGSGDGDGAENGDGDEDRDADRSS